MSHARYIVGDALTVLRTLPTASVACVVTSPPYWGLRDYLDDPAEIGTGGLAEYLGALVAVFRETRRVLDPAGLAWVNIGDTQAGSGGAGGDYLTGKRQGQRAWKQGSPGLSPRNACLVPQKLAVGVQGDGWIVRKWVTWDKGRLRPESLDHARRPGSSSETVLMLAKDPAYFFDATALVERGDVWHFDPETARTGHAAPFPVELPSRCIGPSLPGVVLDPFAGSGTTLEVATGHGRDAIGIDLDERNVELALERVGPLLLTVEHHDPSLPSRLR